MEGYLWRSCQTDTDLAILKTATKTTGRNHSNRLRPDGYIIPKIDLFNTLHSVEFVAPIFMAGSINDDFIGG